VVEHNFYDYNRSGMPQASNNGVGIGMFPYYTCTLTCHKSDTTYGVNGKIGVAAAAWLQSKHAQSFTGSETNSCAKCKSPPNYNVSAPSSTVIAQADWQGIQCRVCHNLHDRKFPNNTGPGGFPIAFYNSTRSSLNGYATYDKLTNSTQLCENCHAGTSHDSKFAGTHRYTVGFDCTDCHMNATFNNELHIFEVKNTATGVTGCEVCHKAEDHTFQFTSKHTGKVTCEACHDKTVSKNATGYAVSSDGKSYGLYRDPATGLVSSWKDSHGTPATWPLHNISRPVSCDKCHGTLSKPTGLQLAPDLAAMACADCHTSYGDDYSASKHNQAQNPNAPYCTDCHVGYVSGHATGNTGFIVNQSNTCVKCHVQGMNGFDFGKMSSSTCTQCHFANTTARFSLDPSFYVHDHNLSIEHNYYYYNRTGTIRMPLRRNGGDGDGMFPYWACSQACHGGTGVNPLSSFDNASITWLKSKHAQSLVEPPLDQKVSCAKCKSPVNYNVSANQSSLIPVADWQGIQCRVCHDIMNISYSNSTGGKPLAFYNATASSIAGYSVYDQVHNATELCEKCHTGTSHDSKFGGTHKDRVGFDCASCHLNTTSAARGGFNNRSHSFEVKNAYTGVTGCEVCHNAENHTFQFTSKHTGKVTCEACHDKTVARNATGFAVSSDGKSYGLYLDPATGLISSWKDSHGTPATWPLHNISKPVNCDKCHDTKSKSTGLVLAPSLSTLGCTDCHTSYGDAYNASKHNRALNPFAPACTSCHVGYVSGHATGTTGFIVNESNTCRNCHIDGDNGFYERHTGSSDCTQCHFANTTQRFSLDESLYSHDHALTIEHNFYDYNLSGMPLHSNGGSGVGMFPYYTCTLTCHRYNTTSGTEGIIDEAASSWLQSKHAQSFTGSETNSCAKCKSPPDYNVSAPSSAKIAQKDWQGIQCRVCHNLHDRRFPNNTGPRGFPIAFYNSTLSSLNGYATYDQLTSATQLCENCHTGTSHDSKFAGTHRTTVGFNCTDCHMNATFNNELHLFEVKNTTSGVTGCKVCHDAAHLTFSSYQYHVGEVQCWACHDQTVTNRNASNYSVSSDRNYGLFKDSVTGTVNTYKVSHGTPAAWPLHNISRSVTCTKCHGARSAFTGGIAPGFGGDYTYITQTSNPLISGYNLVALGLIIDPAINANDILSTSAGGISGANKVMRWNSSAQQWEGYEYIAGVGYLGNNFALDGYNAYFIKGNASTAGLTYTFKGRK